MWVRAPPEPHPGLKTKLFPSIKEGQKHDEPVSPNAFLFPQYLT